MQSEQQLKAINTLRFLSVDGVFKANSGHPGLPMGAAAMAYTIWSRHLRFNPSDPTWPDRDRFILSGGHGSMLLYSLLHLTGFALTLDDLKSFRQFGSLTPGHPEIGVTPGVETTTGPLGQGFANGVGMAVAEAHLAAIFNKPGHEIIDHFVYAIVTDGDLMEGVTAEAASFAGHQKLGKLIYLYDDNRITIDGSTELAFTEDRGKRFEAYGWQVLHVEDGNDVDLIDAAIIAAKHDPRPSLIICRTHIGYGFPTLVDTPKIHGSPPPEGELRQAKLNAGWPADELFHIPADMAAHFQELGKQGAEAHAGWDAKLAAYATSFPAEHAELLRRLAGKLPDGWKDVLPAFAPDAKGMATRSASGKVLNKLAAVLPELMGGSADLAPSNNTNIDGSPAFQADARLGRNFHFGVREHGMASIVNGMAVHGGVIPYGATFLVFTDYARPALRLSALSHIPSIWIMTHDSIGLGEDGPTHQPIEHLAALRAIPNMTVIRPADANEVTYAWQYAIENRHGPTLLALTRQNVPVFDRSLSGSAADLLKGAYILAEVGEGKPELLLMASGSEVAIALDSAYRLASKGINTRVISFPSWELFERQPIQYRNELLPSSIRYRVAIEAGVSQGWEKYTGSEGLIIGIDKFGASAPYQDIYREYGLTPESIEHQVLRLMGVSEEGDVE